MIKGIGIDIVEIERVQKVCERQGRFPERILSEQEIEVYRMLSGKRKIEFLAGRFAAKEAYAKANGTGFGEELSFTDIEISVDSKGKPYITKPKEQGVHLSITHSAQYAVAQVIIEEI
ncbi:holo-ACP synthase [Heyndrickxia camelliae]|uniref:Holo-[acyl-carrier-protein] synthase n=1 Tax=Heyndrickxia camelliae TaxID=1707093 RepID=A0A2N3LD49_9BACI|nr:holo-ACP synthase [Heyndrickxia camelliae]PKR82541.1 holo-ACP synthase [Heyndrickxia camelliae]